MVYLFGDHLPHWYTKMDSDSAVSVEIVSGEMSALADGGESVSQEETSSAKKVSVGALNRVIGRCQ